jgi:hypothetical protein
MELASVLDALSKEPVRALLTTLRYGSLDYLAVQSLAPGGTADAALKQLVLLGALDTRRADRRSSYDLTVLGRDLLEAVDLAAGLPGGVVIFDILRGKAGMHVLIHHLGYRVRDLHEFASTTRSTVTRRLRDSGVLDQARPPQVVDRQGHRMLLIHLHLLVYRHYERLAQRAWTGASGLLLEALRPEDAIRVSQMPGPDDPDEPAVGSWS